MAAKKNGNGHDPTERMVRILESIEHEIHAFREETNERLGRLETEAKQTNERLGRLETQAKKTNRRLSNVEKRLTTVEVSGTAALEERVERLEARVHDLEAAE
jgi:polyhydroxyalkanoate synthesis regulator phasin